ncbi:hypothetical protein D9V37_18755 [Nocardioides mangrovicus]|uniref:Uncharacterized protein n=1 Tax=Nocardioides mangrovicus TaxID=2478913 RepID=A0A3L8NY99_9ACTN|nr:hypothetical protein [Nocardioides mangrovicus]RLV48120.1 hypothetical protein D9V37_18755 [Nocardioides mangrovicus]
MALPADACSGLVGLAERCAAGDPAPHVFLRRLARGGAGVRPLPLGVLDLARGGRNLVRGRGFRAVYDDGSAGQVRHFCGVARACQLLGVTATRWLMEHSGDATSSPDGQLTEAAIVFVRDLRSGRLPVAGAAAWIDQRLCR